MKDISLLIEDYDLHEWVEQVSDETNREFREAVHTILSAIASDKNLRASMVLKGGILLAIRYQSHRFTKDIDLSTYKILGDDLTVEQIVSTLNDSLSSMVEMLDYDLDCLVQSYKLQPKNPDATYPSVSIKVGYAYKGTSKHKRLLSRQSPSIISIDYSLNEATPNIDTLQLVKGGELQVYSLTDLIAEKYRSLLQQIERNRNRRQDVFDLFLIFDKFENFDEIEKSNILKSLIKKAKYRNISATIDSFDNPEIKQRASHEYDSLADEIEGELPDFENSFRTIVEFYRSLPW